MATTESGHRTLADLGLDGAPAVHWNLRSPTLCERTIVLGTGMLAARGPLVVHTPRLPAKEAPIAAPMAAISSSAWKVFTPKCR